MTRDLLGYLIQYTALRFCWRKEKDGDIRLCIDYRAHYVITRRDSYPLSSIDALLDDLQGAQYFSKVNLRSGYHEVRVREEDIHETALTTHMGSFEWCVLSMGLTNAPTTFQRSKQSVLGSFSTFCRIYLDDIIIFSITREQHKQHLQQFLEALRKHQLKLYPRKCVFAVQQVDFLGHCISPGKIMMEEDIVGVVQQWPVPTTKKEMQSFLGSTNFYRNFIHNYAHIASLLSDALHNNAPPSLWQQLPKAVLEAFNRTTEAMAAATALQIMDATRQSVIYTEASDVIMGATVILRFLIVVTSRVSER